MFKQFTILIVCVLLQISKYDFKSVNSKGKSVSYVVVFTVRKLKIQIVFNKGQLHFITYGC